MPSEKKRQEVFSVSYDLLLQDKKTPYDLFINSSSKSDKARFVRVFPKGDVLTTKFIKEFKSKYKYIYILESQRSDYLKSLIDSDSVPDIKKAKVIKDTAIHYLNDVFSDEKEFTTELLEETIEGCKESVEGMIKVIEEKSIGQIQDLIANLSYHDFYTFDHSVNVAMYCIGTLKALRPDVPKKMIQLIGIGGLLHDLGKVNIPTSIINSPDKLSDDEFNKIKEHPQTGSDIIHDNPCGHAHFGVDLEVVARIMLEHHENFNGTGYPSKLSGKDIHLFARITAIADFFDAITTQRSYHKALSTEDAIGIMKNSMGKKIDPNLFKVFAKNALAATKKVVGREVMMKCLPDDFDPCMPYKELPFDKFKPKYLMNELFEEEERDKNFGDIKIKT